MTKASVNATITKIRALHGRMLTAQDYKILAGKKSVSEVAEYLRTHERFSHLLAGIDANTIHRGYLEELIRKSNFELYVKLRDFQHLKHDEFYNCVCLKYETQQLLSLISSILSGTREQFIVSFPAYLIRQTKLDFQELSKCQSLHELSKALEGTRYEKPMGQIVGLSDKADYLSCEVILRTHYFRNLLQSIKNDLPKADAALISKAVRSELDVRNVVNAYRMKAYFGAPSELMKQSRLPFSKMGKEKMEKLYECRSAEEMIEYVRQASPGISALFESGDFIETAMARLNLKAAKKLLRTQSMPAVYYAILQLCDIEADNITHIIEGIRYELSDEKIEELIAY